MVLPTFSPGFVGPQAAPRTSAPARPRRRLTRRGEAVVAVVLLSALTMLFFYPVLTGSTFSTVPGHQTAIYPWRALPSKLTDTFPQTDQADVSHPWHSFISESLRSGSFPFWDPYSFGGGYPFFADGATGILYPPRLLTALTLDPAWSHDVMSMLNVFLAGLFMYALMRELDVGFAGSLLAAVSWMFGAFNMAWLHLEPVAPTAVFLPLAVLAVHRAVRLESWSATVLAGLVLGLTLVSGQILLFGLVYAVALGYGAALVARRIYARARSGDRRWTFDIGRLGAMVVVSLGSAAVVLLPTASVLADSQRDSFTYQQLRTDALHFFGGDIPLLPPPRTFLYTFVPPPLPLTALRMHEMVFVGTVTAAFAIVGLFLRRPGAGLGRALFITVFLVAVGTPVTWLAYHLLPGFDILRPYSRLLNLSSFAVAVLGGLGLDALRRYAGSLRPRVRLTGMERLALRGVPLVAIAATAAQLVQYGKAVNPPFVAREEASLFPVTPLIEAARREVRRPGRWPGRIIPMLVADDQGRYPGALVLFAADAMLFGIDSTAGYDAAVPRRVTAMMRVLQGEDPETVLRTGLPSSYAPSFLSGVARLELLARLGVTTIVASPRLSTSEEWGPVGRGLPKTEIYSGPDGRVLRLDGVQAGPYLVHGDEVVRGEAEALRRFSDPDFDFRRSVVVEQGELRRTGETRLGENAGTAQVLSATRGANSARMTVTTSAPAWLVVPDSWAQGWSASVDRRRTEVVRVNYAKRAVRVPPGRSLVEFRYRPPGFGVGIYLTVLTFEGCVAVVAVDALRRLRTARPAFVAARPSQGSTG